MGNFAIIRQRINAAASQPITSTFDFSAYGTIGAVVWGISAFNFSESSYEQPPTEHSEDPGEEPLQQMVISLSQGGGGIGSDFLDLQVTITLSDSQDEESWVDVTVVAYIGAAYPEGIHLNYLTGVNGTPSPGASNDWIALTAAPSVCAGVLAGFGFTSTKSSAALGFGASAGSTLSPFVEPTKTQAAPLGNGVCLVSNEEPFTTTIDVGSIIFTTDQSTTQEQLVVGTYQYSFGQNNDPDSGQNAVSIQTPPLADAAVFLQSFFVQFEIGNQEVAQAPTPQLGQATVGAENVACGDNGGLTFTSYEYMFSPYTGHQGGSGFTDGAYALSNAANYLYIGILKNPS